MKPELSDEKLCDIITTYVVMNGTCTNGVKEYYGGWGCSNHPRASKPYDYLGNISLREKVIASFVKNGIKHTDLPRYFQESEFVDTFSESATVDCVVVSFYYNSVEMKFGTTECPEWLIDMVEAVKLKKRVDMTPPWDDYLKKVESYASRT